MPRAANRGTFCPVALGAKVECLWVGPFVSDFDCSSCVLGYETTSATDTTCVKPAFKPYRGWASSPERARLTLQDVLGVETEQGLGDGAGTRVLLSAHTYTVPAPLLEPKQRRFAGYEQPYTKIHYELDFSLGAEVR